MSCSNEFCHIRLISYFDDKCNFFIISYSSKSKENEPV